jgi:hypothetical protein
MSIQEFIASLDKNKEENKAMTVVSLRLLCRNRNIKSTGCKNDLVSKLLLNDNTFEVLSDHPYFVPQLQMELGRCGRGLWYVFDSEKGREEDFSWQVVKQENLETYMIKWKKEREDKIQCMLKYLPNK